MRKAIILVICVICTLTFIGASCHPKRSPQQIAPPPPPVKIQEPEKKLEPKEEKKPIQEETIKQQNVPQEEPPYKQEPLSPTLGAAENMARDSLKLLEKGDVISAALTAERAIGIEPYCGYCYYALASIRAAQKMWKDVIPLSTSALQYFSSSDKRAAKAAYIRALAYYNTGERDRARADCEFALSIDPDLEAAKRLLSSIY